ncbi:MAG: hypothetical protein JST40_09440 [Armatimonadetes bacterium]|nr:hypothetical protein [Armatimonadota bacterium]
MINDYWFANRYLLDGRVAFCLGVLVVLILSTIWAIVSHIRKGEAIGWRILHVLSLAALIQLFLYACLEFGQLETRKSLLYIIIGGLIAYAPAWIRKTTFAYRNWVAVYGSLRYAIHGTVRIAVAKHAPRIVCEGMPLLWLLGIASICRAPWHLAVAGASTGLIQLSDLRYLGLIPSRFASVFGTSAEARAKDWRDGFSLDLIVCGASLLVIAASWVTRKGTIAIAAYLATRILFDFYQYWISERGYGTFLRAKDPFFRTSPDIFHYLGPF